MSAKHILPALLVLTVPLPAAAQLVGIDGARPPQNLRLAHTPPDVFTRAAFAVSGTDFSLKVKGIPERRDPLAVYGPDGAGSLMVLAADGIVSLGPQGQNRLLVPAARLDQAHIDDAGRRGAAAINPDGDIYMLDLDGNVVRIPARTTEPPVIVVSSERLDAAAGGQPWVVNDLLYARGMLWIAADGPIGLSRVADSGALERMYDPFADLEAAGWGTENYGVKALCREPGQPEVVFAMSWDLDAPDSGVEPESRLGGVDEVDAVFRIETSRTAQHILKGGALAKGLASLGEGAFLVARDNGDVVWFNYASTSKTAMPVKGAVSVLKALIEDLEDENLVAQALVTDCEDRAYLMLGWKEDGSPAGIVTVSGPNPEPTPGDVLLVSAQFPQILRVTPFGEPMLFREGGLESDIRLLNPTAIARSPKDGAVAVADQGSHQVMRFTAAGVPMPEYDANVPVAVAYDAEGSLYYLDIDFEKDRDLDPPEVRGGGPAVIKRPTGSTHRTVLWEFPGGSPSGLAARADGRVLVGDLIGQTVVEIPAEGGEPTVLPGTYRPLSLLVDAEGALWIGGAGEEDGGEGKLMRLAEGADQPEVILPREGGYNPLRNPGGLAETDDGRIVIADWSADAYPGATATGGLFSIRKDGTDVRVLLDHPDYPPPSQGVGVIFIPGERPDICELPEIDYTPRPKDLTDGDEGCECSLGARSGSGPAWLLLALAGALGLRRRQP